MEHRPDLEQARLDLNNKQASVKFTRNQKKYRLDFVAGVGSVGLSGDVFSVDFTSPTPSRVPLSSTGGSESILQVLRSDFPNWSAELQLGIPIGNRAADANYARAKLEQDQSELTIARLEQQAQVQVRDAVRLIETNLERVRAAEVNRRLQGEKLEAEQKKYENGMSTAFQILQFQTDLTSAELRYNEALVGYNKSLVELDRVMGILIESRNISIQ